MRRLSFLAPLCLGLLAGPALMPQDAAAQKMAKGDPAAEDASEQLTGRLPNYYGKVGVSDDQRQDIYRIQAEYDGRIEDLLDEIGELRGERDEKVQAILTAEQLTEVKRMKAEARAKRAARRNS